METIDRALFVPDDSNPNDDSLMLIGYNGTISAPHMHVMCYELLEKTLQPGMRALDIGSYICSCHLVEASSIENIQKSKAAPLRKDG
ncbi:hypothetical protein QQ045_017480 [Rhodiola kirilowii]